MSSLFKEFNFSKSKFIYYKKIYSAFEIYNKIILLSKKIDNKKKGVVSLFSNNKIDFIIKFYALNKSGFQIYLNDNNSKRSILDEKINIHNNLIKLNSFKSNYNNKNLIILKTSGSTNMNKYVYLTQNNISYVCTMMNKEMFKKNKVDNELIFAPLNHAFAFGRMHSLIKSKNSFLIPDYLSFSNFFNIFEKSNNITALSITSGFFTKLLKLDFTKTKKILKKINYIQLSSGYFPLNLRKKILRLKTNLFINYGMTEAMRSTFLNCMKNRNKIHTEGRPFTGVKVKILKSKKSTKGEIMIKGKNLAKCYSNSKEWNSRIIDGWFKTGDLGKLDKDNFLIYSNRISDNLNINDINYSKSSIENLIQNKFRTSNLKIINLKKRNQEKLYLFIDKKIKREILYKFLLMKKININFEKIIYRKNMSSGTLGKISYNKILKYINE